MIDLVIRSRLWKKKIKEGEKIKEEEKRKMVGGNHNEGEKNIVDVVNRGEKGGGNVVDGKPVLEGVSVRELREEDLVVAHVSGKGVSFEVQPLQVYVPKYKSAINDVSWASKGLVVSVLNGEAIPVLQRRIFYAGFDKLAIIPMGANKAFLRSLDEGDASLMLSEATDFFNNFFSKPVKWNKNFLIRERDAWVRIYGVPLHAWNIDFFKLCVLDVGRLLRVDDITLDKDRFDYARVLLSTTSLDIIRTGLKL